MRCRSWNADAVIVEANAVAAKATRESDFTLQGDA